MCSVRHPVVKPIQVLLVQNQFLSTVTKICKHDLAEHIQTLFFFLSCTNLEEISANFFQEM